MIRTLVYPAALSVLVGGCVIVDEARVCEERPAPGHVRPAGTQPVPVLRHVVLFQLHEETRAEDVRRIENAFSALPSRIDVIRDFEWGTDVSVANLQRGFTHCFVVSFRSEADRGVYLPHPAPQEFIELMKPHLAEALVVDYGAN